MYMKFGILPSIPVETEGWARGPLLKLQFSDGQCYFQGERAREKPKYAWRLNIKSDGPNITGTVYPTGQYIPHPD